jgi:hypothetical protein
MARNLKARPIPDVDEDDAVRQQPLIPKSMWNTYTVARAVCKVPHAFHKTHPWANSRETPEVSPISPDNQTSK